MTNQIWCTRSARNAHMFDCLWICLMRSENYNFVNTIFDNNKYITTTIFIHLNTCVTAKPQSKSIVLWNNSLSVLVVKSLHPHLIPPSPNTLLPLHPSPISQSSLSVEKNPAQSLPAPQNVHFCTLHRRQNPKLDPISHQP